MIGLNRGDDDDGARAGEPPETMELRKPKLYKMLEGHWLLPPRDSKGVCRTYLISDKCLELDYENTNILKLTSILIIQRRMDTQI